MQFSATFVLGILCLVACLASVSDFLSISVRIVLNNI